MSLLPPASVVIPSWNGARLLGPTLERLLALEEVDFEALVVDHGRLNLESQEVVAAFTARDSRIRYLGLDEQLGYAGAVNYGSRRATNHLVAVLCNDVLVEKGWLAELVRKHQERRALGRTAVVSSLVERPGFAEPLACRLNLWGRIVRAGEPPARAEAYTPFFPDGSAFLFDRASLGLPFDASYFLYQEDVSLGWRAWLTGGEVVLAPLSRALNADGGTTRRTPYRTAFYTERNRWLNMLTFYSGRSLARMAPLLLGDALLQLLFGSNRLAKLHAWAWLCAHPLDVAAKRSALQRLRRRGDAQILPLLSTHYLNAGGPVAALANRAVRGYLGAVGWPGAGAR